MIFDCCKVKYFFKGRKNVQIIQSHSEKQKSELTNQSALNFLRKKNNFLCLGSRDSEVHVHASRKIFAVGNGAVHAFKLAHIIL